jgi:hypothetical protein
MSNDPTPTTNASRPYSNDTSQEVREQVLRNDQRTRKPYSPRKIYEDEPTTFQSWAQADAGIPRGRFTEIEKVSVVGSTASPSQYPAVPMHDTTGIEPPTGEDINAMEPVGTAKEIKASIERSLGGDPATGPPTPDQSAHPVRFTGSSPTDLTELDDGLAPTGVCSSAPTRNVADVPTARSSSSPLGDPDLGPHSPSPSRVDVRGVSGSSTLAGSADTSGLVSTTGGALAPSDHPADGAPGRPNPKPRRR